MDSCRSYAFRGTLVYGDIYGQILVWLLVVFLSLAAGLALMGASQPLVGIAAIDLVFVLSMPFLLISFVTTLIGHIVLDERPAFSLGLN
jgi:hypothetical protein